MKYYAPAAVLISVINASGWDTDLQVPAGRKIDIDDETCVGTTLSGKIMTMAVGGE